ncbi:MAG: 1-acyl-sn-glycerol-3-phosphate acyltransferase [Ruminococcaceae bacterium]|nr:1-acyl-sn-glycerol-3-phosphate acyltransferase [Oscillospiraceae bacterium]
MSMDRFFHVLYTVVWPFFNLVHPVKAVGRENIPEGAALICPNHTKASDPFFVLYAFGRRHVMRAMAKAEVMRLPVVGWLLSKAGVFGVDRGAADINAVKTALRFLKQGDKLLMFPEGTRVEEGENVEAKTGAAMFSVRTGAPIIPVYIPAKKRWFRPTTVVIGEPFTPQVAGRKGTSEEYHAIVDDLMSRIRALGEECR